MSNCDRWLLGAEEGAKCIGIVNKEFRREESELRATE